MSLLGQSKKRKTISFPYPSLSGVVAIRNEAKEGMNKEVHHRTSQKHKL